MQLGNGRYETTQFNSRLQPTQIGLGTSTTDTSLLKLNYDYGTADNNGNVKTQTITVPGMTYPLIQTYAYDTLNRLKSAEEKSNGATTWKQTFLYDRYGNRNFDTANTTTLGSCSQAQCNPTVSASNNRFASGQGYGYDLAGNTTLDSEGRQFTYDAENKQTQVKDVNNAVIGTYSYDGDGKRVKKAASTETTVFVYDAMGRSAEEYSGSTLQTAYVYAGSRLLTTETATGTNYLTSDHLGSPRINTDQTGTVTARHDYMPFGEEIFTVGGRTAGLGYNSDTVRKKFTGYERDSESSLDFAKARYHNFSQGRFLSPDPQKIVVDVQLERDEEEGQRLLKNYLNQPVQWNRYVYAVNNPIKYTDPDGRQIQLSKNLTEAERNQILYYLSRNTRDKLNWKTDKNGNVIVTITEVKGKAQNEGTRLIRRLSNYQSVVTIQLGTGGNGTNVDNTTSGSNGVGSNSTITFNPNSNPLITTLDPKTGNGLEQIRPSHIGLIHELIHADHAARGTILTGIASYLYRDSNGNVQVQSDIRREEFATVGLGGQNNKMDITENNIRMEQGLNLRAAY